MSWETVQLGDVIQTLKGYAFKSSHYVESGVPIVRASNFTMDSISNDDLKFYTQDEAAQFKKYELTTNDVLIQTVGSWESNPASVVGKVVRVPQLLNGALLNQNIVKVFPADTNQLNLQYLFYRLKCHDFKRHNIGNAVGAANQASITLETIRTFTFELPSLSTQKRIAEILKGYDDLIENNQKQIKLLEEAAQRLYKEWFVDLRFPGYENTPIIDGVPEGWIASTVGGICDLKKDTVLASKIAADTPYIGLEHMPRVDFCLSNWGMAEDATSNKFSYAENDIIFGKIRPYFHKVGFALNSGVVSTDSFVMVAKQGLWGLLLMTVFDKAFVDYTYQTCKEGAKMPRADWNQMEKYPVLVPSEDVRQQFEDYIWAVTRRIKGLVLQNHALAEARDRLLPKLMNGEIEV